ncbi:MAG: VWA domain-containing protein [Atopobiaceae bacterium]
MCRDFRSRQDRAATKDRAATILLAITAFLLAFVLVGCGQPGATATDGSPADSSDSQTSSSQSSDGSSNATSGATLDDSSQSNVKVQTFTPSQGNAAATLKVASGSENHEAATAIQHAVDSSGVAVQMHYMGSLDIMNLLKDGGQGYDAVWPASSIWISLGDTSHIVKDASSTSTTPVVLGISRQKAISLGWANSDGSTQSVSTADIIKAVESGSLSFSMTSATQSNSGASAYLAFLTALANTGQPLTAADLQNTQLTSQVHTLLAGVDHSSGSSDWLKQMVVSSPDDHQAMVNYESLVIQANKQLERNGNDPLLAIYPSDGIAVSDSPLGYIDRGQGQDTKDAFEKFQDALSDDQSKLDLERVGRRCGLGGKLANPDDDQVKAAFRSDWGISTDSSVLKSITFPTADVISQALVLYQSDLRKPSYTVWVVDYSGSMYGEGKEGVVNGLNQALDPTQAAQSMIQPATGDVNVLVPFSSTVGSVCTANGTDTAALLRQAADTDANGGTDLYAGLSTALDLIKDIPDPSSYTIAIVAMTDGESRTDNMAAFEQSYRDSGTNVPIFSIMFGQANSEQLDQLASLSDGKVFDGRTGNLADVFREVKGYN